MKEWKTELRTQKKQTNYQNNYTETLLFCYFLFQELGITACTLQTPWLTDWNHWSRLCFHSYYGVNGSISFSDIFLSELTVSLWKAMTLSQEEQALHWKQFKIWRNWTVILLHPRPTIITDMVVLFMLPMEELTGSSRQGDGSESGSLRSGPAELRPESCTIRPESCDITPSLL